MIVAHANNLTKYEYDSSEHQFIEVRTIEIEHPWSLIEYDDHIYFRHKDGIMKVDNDLGLVKELKMDRMGVIVESNGVFYFSANGSFYSCDPNLEIMS
jgi:hypothetical protein